MGNTWLYWAQIMRTKRRSRVLRSVLTGDHCINKKLNNDSDNTREDDLSRPDGDVNVYRPLYSVDDEMKDGIYNKTEEVYKRRILMFVSP
jgi:hypothetical protein